MGRTNPFSKRSSTRSRITNLNPLPLPNQHPNQEIEFQDPTALFKVKQFVAEQPSFTEPEPAPESRNAASHPTALSSTSSNIAASTEVEVTEEEMMDFTAALFSLPTIVWDKIPQRTTKQLTPFNRALYIYCNKKGIDPYDYFFDEFPLLLAGIGVCGGIYRDYKELYPKKEENKKKDAWKEDTVKYNVEKDKEGRDKKEDTVL